jgi:hypothetical protein
LNEKKRGESEEVGAGASKSEESKKREREKGRKGETTPTTGAVLSLPFSPFSLSPFLPF